MCSRLEIIMNKKIIKTASVIAVGAGAAALYKAKFAKDNDSERC